MILPHSDMLNKVNNMIIPPKGRYLLGQKFRYDKRDFFITVSAEPCPIEECYFYEFEQIIKHGEPDNIKVVRRKTEYLHDLEKIGKLVLIK